MTVHVHEYAYMLDYNHIVSRALSCSEPIVDLSLAFMLLKMVMISSFIHIICCDAMVHTHTHTHTHLKPSLPNYTDDGTHNTSASVPEIFFILFSSQPTSVILSQSILLRTKNN